LIITILITHWTHWQYFWGSVQSSLLYLAVKNKKNKNKNKTVCLWSIVFTLADWSNHVRKSSPSCLTGAKGKAFIPPRYSHVILWVKLWVDDAKAFTEEIPDFSPLLNISLTFARLSCIKMELYITILTLSVVLPTNAERKLKFYNQ